jgi:hypothetical protein
MHLPFPADQNEEQENVEEGHDAVSQHNKRTAGAKQKTRMSLYQVQKLLFHVNREPKTCTRFLNDRENLLSEYRLTEEERRAILEPDFRRLYEMGVHSLLLGPLAATLGRSFPDYLAILRGKQP